MLCAKVLIFLQLVGLSAALPSSNAQHALTNPQEQLVKQRTLNGKFLHITDLHPDPFYKLGTDPFGEHPCHRGKGSAGFYGAEKTECDSPFSLINATFDWIRANVKEEIDFVVWTGDSARHDNDDKIPRTPQGVEDLNRYVVSKFAEVFGLRKGGFEIPIIPTYGNNDILPHNIFQPGPNRWTKKYLDIWEDFIPQEQRHSFARGGYFYTEVIPNKLAVFSLNTLYFFDSNAAVDGCDNPSEPGYEHFEWLRVQLEFLRQRGMKAIVTGHVPPARTESKQNWDESCYQKYTLWLRQYRDVIVGNLYGHMNIDHFMFQDMRELKYRFRIDGVDNNELSNDNGFASTAKTDYLSELRETWGALPPTPHSSAYAQDEDNTQTQSKKKRRLKKFLKAIGGPYGERFSVSLVSPSVVPNFYPTMRIVKYNITGLESLQPAHSSNQTPAGELLDQFTPSGEDQAHFQSLSNYEDEDVPRIGYELVKQKHKKKKGHKNKPNFKVPDPPSKSSPPGPAYSPQTLSFISWRQLYANLTEINEAVSKELEATTSPLEEVNNQVLELLFRKHFYYKQEYHTKDDEVYHMPDLTMRSWIDLAQKIGRSTYNPISDLSVGEDDDQDLTRNITMDHAVGVAKKHKGKKRKHKTLKQNQLWHAFVKRAFVSSKTDEELQDDFG